MTDAFTVRDCVLLAMATGRRAQTLQDLREGVLAVPQESIYYHFRGRLLRPRFDDTEFHNDHVRQNFLVTRQLREYLTVMLGLVRGFAQRIELY